MHLTFFTITRHEPVGGAIQIYELANGLCRRGHHVEVIHVFAGRGAPIRAASSIGWMRFEPGVEHQFVTLGEEVNFPEADFVCLTGELPPHAGLQFDLVQGYGMMRPQEAEDEALRTPIPKAVVGSWLIPFLVERFGVPEHQLVHIPNGLDHETFRITRPIEDRPPLVSMLYRNHPRKGPVDGLAALAAVVREQPGTRAIVFSQVEPVHKLPEGIEVVVDPPRAVLVNDIYNASSIFVCSSVMEGFGMMCIEAMACGAALVTTDNAGSDDYAIHDDTALVSPPRDSDALAANVLALLRDDDRRHRIARAGAAYVRRFDWDASSLQLERFLLAYGADPAAYQQPVRAPVS